MFRSAPDLPRLLSEWQQLTDTVRSFFAERGVREVATPQLYPTTCSAPGLQSFVLPGERPAWLQTSPELPMKRLLAAGSGPIFQIAQVFRAQEHGRRHRTEFRMLEWYRPGFSMQDLQQELLALLHELGIGMPVRYRGFAECFLAATGLDPWRAGDGELRMLAREQLDLRAELHRAELLDLLFASLAEPAMPVDVLQIVHSWPPELAENATCLERDGRQVAERFELFGAGMELANGCEELRDAQQWRARQQRDNVQRAAAGLERIPEDTALLGVLDQLPPCTGVALGLDRLLMLKLGCDDISDVQPLELLAGR